MDLTDKLLDVELLDVKLLDVWGRVREEVDVKPKENSVWKVSLEDPDELPSAELDLKNEVLVVVTMVADEI